MYTPTIDLPRSVTIYWRVKANGANPSNWSEVRTFTGANPPGVPSLVAPANAALVSNYLPRLDWSNSSVPAGTTFQKYQLQVATSNSFGPTVVVSRILLGLPTVSEFTLTNPLDAQHHLLLAGKRRTMMTVK